MRRLLRFLLFAVFGGGRFRAAVGEGGRESSGKLERQRKFTVFRFQVLQNLFAGTLRLETLDQPGVVGRVQQDGLRQPLDRSAGEFTGAEEQQRVQRRKRRYRRIHFGLAQREHRRHGFDVAVRAAQPGGELAVGHDLTAVEFDPPGFQELVEGRAARLRVRLLPHAGNREGIEESQHLAAPQDELVECEQHPVAEILRLERQNHVDIRSDFSAGNGNLHHVIVAFEFGDDPPRRIRRAVHHHRGSAVAAHHRQRA